MVWVYTLWGDFFLGSEPTGQTNIAMENEPEMKMYFLLNMGDVSLPEGMLK